MDKKEERNAKQRRIEEMASEIERIKMEYKGQLKEEIGMLKREEREIKRNIEKKERELLDWEETLKELELEKEEKRRIWLEMKEERKKQEIREEEERKSLEQKKKKIIIKVVKGEDFDLEEWLKKHNLTTEGTVRKVGWDYEIYEIVCKTEVEIEAFWEKEREFEREGRVKILKWISYEQRRRNYLVNKKVRSLRKEIQEVQEDERNETRALAFEIEGNLYVIGKQNKVTQEKKREEKKSV